ncbi:penicillin-binding protein [Candidatus Daviesbacteria bacterium]|nr:penicillin-binding protein [Candidatus Daviesbacteria bacterium]
MAKGRTVRHSKKLSFLKLAFLLPQLVLIRIGQIPLFIVYHISFIVKKIFSFRIPVYHIRYTIHFPPLHFSLPRHWRGRGRPRKTWFVPYYLTKFRIFVKRRVPKTVKITTVTFIAIICLLLYTWMVLLAAYQIPSPSRISTSDKALTTEVFDRNGRLLFRFYEGRNRSLVTLHELPRYVVQATIAAEDKNFYSHIGIDPVAIVRALIANIKNQTMEGASTITQQLIKNTLLTPEKTYTRKIKEIFLALWTERLYSKDQILQMYLTEAPYGGPAWGIEAASETYFGKSSKELTLAQAAYLAGLPASPTQFSPYGGTPELGKNRQKEVLRRMIEDKFITQYQADLAYQEDLHLRPQINNIKAAHFVMYVKDLLSQKYGQKVVSQGGLKITTTLDLDLQEGIEKIVSAETDKLIDLNVKNAAAMVTDAKTGQILAMVGSKDYHQPDFGAFNVAVSLRQPGSSIKVVTYVTAFKQGFSPGNTILDVPVIFRDEWGNSYSPVNYDGAYHGAVSIRTALGSSYNIPAVKLLATVGLSNMIKTAQDLGITTFTDPKKYGLSITLGAAEVKMTDMITVYGTLSQMGAKRVATPILKVTDSTGNILEEYEDQPKQVIPQGIAYLITSILTDNKARTPAFGNKSLLNIQGKTVAVKTGTSDNKRDNWTFGYTPEYVVGVWVGNNDNSPMNPSLTSGVTGAAPIWNKIMTGLLADKADVSFARPLEVVEASIDGRKDLTLASFLPKSLVRVIQNEDQLHFSDSFSSYATSSAQASSKEVVNN